MTLDAMALATVLNRADGWEVVVARAHQGAATRISSTAIAEAGMLMVAQHGVTGLLGMHEVLTQLQATVVPFTEADWFHAVQAYHDRLKSPALGPARFGACLTAAIAVRTGTAVLSAPPTEPR